MKKLALFIAVGLAFSATATAQDKIYRINPVEEIEGRVLEVGEQSVRYTRADTRQDVTFSVPVQYLQKIVFEDGKQMIYNDMVDMSNDRRDAIKLSFLSPILDAPTLSYEHSIQPGQSVEFGLGVIGAGLTEVYDQADGVILKAGYKFISRPEYYQSQFRYAHLLKGSYIKPELTFVHYSYSDELVGSDAHNHDQVTLINFGIVGGKQWVFQDRFLLDIFGGIGIGLGDCGGSEWHYNFIGSGEGNATFTLTTGFKIGVLLGKRR
jgi:opacity protein-like surface antigen